MNSRHFSLVQLADGVWLAQATAGGWAICNAGIVDLGDRTLVFDAMLAPAAAAELQNAAEALTGRPVTLLVLSHWHNDHVWGAQAFTPECELLSSSTTARLLVEEGPAELTAYRETAPADLERYTVLLSAARTERERREIAFWVGYMEGILASIPTLTFRRPDRTFDGRLALDGERKAELIQLGGGHTAGDVVLHLPEEGIVLTGDLLFTGWHPYLAEAGVEATRTALAELGQLEATVLAPGHGRPVGPDYLDLLARYLDWLETLLNERPEPPAPDDLDIPSPFADWEQRIFLQQSLQALSH